MPLRIWVDALVLESEATGIGQYIRSLFETYCVLYPDDRVTGIFQPGVRIAGVSLQTVPAAMGSVRRLWYEQWALAARIRPAQFDVNHFPDYQVPLLRRVAHTVMTVHDLAAFVMPGVFPRAKTATKRFLMRQSVQTCDQIIVPSQATKRDLVNILSVPPEKIHVVPHGVRRTGAPFAQPLFAAPYFLAVGTVEPRKNFSGLIRAYHLLCQRRQDVPDLVIAGRLGWMYDETLELPEKLGVAERVKFLQYVSEDTLATLYRDAVGFVYPSFYEGFGLPVIEAMQVKIPVVTSSAGALGELGGEFLWRVDPNDIDSIAEQMARVLNGGPEVQSRCEGAREWANQLTWEAAAKKTRDVYEKAALGG